jgi:hypothetical protein
MLMKDARHKELPTREIAPIFHGSIWKPTTADKECRKDLKPAGRNSTGTGSKFAVNLFSRSGGPL